MTSVAKGLMKRFWVAHKISSGQLNFKLRHWVMPPKLPKVTPHCDVLPANVIAVSLHQWHWMSTAGIQIMPATMANAVAIATNMDPPLSLLPWFC